jgi:hypothetical protein
MKLGQYASIFLACIFNLSAANPLDTWVEIDRPQQTGALKTVEFGNGLFVAGGEGGSIITSPDGATWTTRDSGVTDTIWGIKFVNGHFFAHVHSRYNLAITSDNGINWQSITPLLDITYGNGAFYGIHDSNRVAVLRKSTDLLTWTDVPGFPALRNIAFFNGIFFTTDGGWSYTSPDALNWAGASYNSRSPGVFISVQNGTCFVSGSQDYFVPSPFPPYSLPKTLWTAMYSANGQTWNLSLKSKSDYFLSKVAVGGTNYVAVSAAPDVIYYTDNLTNAWTEVTPNFTPESDGPPDVAFGNSRFVAVMYGKILRSSPVGGAFAPEIVKQPASFAATIGGTATFTVVAQGTGPLSYQWRKGSVDLAGATGSTLTLTNVTFDSAGDYDVIVSNSAGSVTSAKAALSINFAQVHRYSGVTLNGAIGDKFLIEYQDELDPAGVWHTSTTVTMASPSLIWIDYSSAETEHRFYRATFQGH